MKLSLELIKKKSEHHEGSLSTLKEIALHQLEIREIEVIGDLCPSLEILLLQGNDITSVAHLNKLHRLRYLNLAVNGITHLGKNCLVGCDKLEKLDLTANNFDGLGLVSLRNLVDNKELRQLYLTGNPCASLDGYREFVISTLPQISFLDGLKIRRSERIAARKRNFVEIFEKEEQERDKRENLQRSDSDLRAQAESVGECKDLNLELENVDLKQVNEPRLSFTMNKSIYSNKNTNTIEVKVGKHIPTYKIEAHINMDSVELKVDGKQMRINLLDETDTLRARITRSMTTGELVFILPQRK